MAGEVKQLTFAEGVSVAAPVDIVESQTVSAKSADYTVTDIDGIRTIIMTTGATTRVVTLPTAADNANRSITVKKADSGIGEVTVDGEGAETIDGAATFSVPLQNDSVTVQCDGTGWHVTHSLFETFTGSGIVGVTDASNATAGNVGEYVEDDFTAAVAAAASANYGEVASLTLSAGDWDITANITYIRNAATVTAGSANNIVIGTTSASSAGATFYRDRIAYDIQDVAADWLHSTLTKRVSISVSDVYYLNAYTIYTGNTPNWGGVFSARRVR